MNMHIFFSAIGGTAIGPLAMIAKQAGFEVSGSDRQNSQYIDYLRKHGIDTIHIGQSKEQITTAHAKKPIDWYVYSSAVSIEQPNGPEFQFCQDHGIKMTKRDEFINHLLQTTGLKMIAIAGTHGKTTTTAMTIWAFKQLGIPVSYSVGAKLSFGDMGHFEPKSEYFVYEADEFDRNFLQYNPYLTIITGIDWDHPDIYPTRELYNQAFRDFLKQSHQTYIWQDDAQKLLLEPSASLTIINKADYPFFSLAGKVNRENAAIVVQAIASLTKTDDPMSIAKVVDLFPGVARRFEKIKENIYSDYAHTPGKIAGAIQMAQEIAGNNVVVIYEGLHNTRQHFIKNDLTHLFDSAKRLYIVPTYRAREDETLEDLTPEKLAEIVSIRDRTTPSLLDETLLASINNHAAAGDLVLCLSAGGGGSLDEWLRANL